MIHIRNFVGDDAEAVQAVARAAWHFTYRDIFEAAFIDQFVDTNYAPSGLRALVSRIEAGQTFFAVAVRGDGIVGFCQIGQTPQGAELFRIYLLPDCVGQGVGSRLLAAGEQYLRRHGYDRYGCYVHRANEIGKRFYAKQGFRHVPERDRDDEYRMEKRLID